MPAHRARAALLLVCLALPLAGAPARAHAPHRPEPDLRAPPGALRRPLPMGWAEVLGAVPALPEVVLPPLAEAAPAPTPASALPRGFPDEVFNPDANFDPRRLDRPESRPGDSRLHGRPAPELPVHRMD